MLAVLALIAPPARAALPWECPVVALPEDAAALRDTDAGLSEVARAVYVIAAARVDPGCAWEASSSGDGVTGAATERRCTTTTGTATLAEWWGRDTWSGAAWSGWRVTVEVTTGETWTRILVQGTADTLGHDDWTLGPGADVRAEWDGALPGLPDDGWLAYAAGQTEGWPTVYTRTVETPACAWTWSMQDDGDFLAESVRVGDTRVEVGGYRAGGCDALPIWATLDGVRLGAADRDTWALDPADTDHDGVLPGCDCDDGDAAVNPYSRDVPEDGIDQDCDGADGDAAGGDADTAPADTGDPDTGATDTGPPDTAATDTPPAGGRDPTPPITSTTRTEPAGCGGAGGAAALLVGLAPVLARRRHGGPPRCCAGRRGGAGAAANGPPTAWGHPGDAASATCSSQ